MFTMINHISSTHYHELMNYPNVVGMGNGYKIVNGMMTDIPVLTIFVSKKQPNQLLDMQDILPCCYMGVLTDVVETGEFFIHNLTSKIRPMQFGYSIGISGFSDIRDCGTAGCMVYDKRDPKKKYILSNNHVMVKSSGNPIGASILQPARADAILTAGTVATLSRYIPILFQSPGDTPINFVDCAIAELISPDIAIPTIAFSGVPTGTILPTLNQRVKKTGRTTGFTTGMITSTSATIIINYGDNKKATFMNQIITTSMSDSGDSGSLLLDMDNKAVGLLFSGSGSRSIYNHIDEVLRALNIELVTGYE